MNKLTDLEIQEIDSLLQYRNLEIKSTKDNQSVVDLCRSVKEVKNTIEEKWKSLTKPFKDGVKKLDLEFKPYVEKLKELEGILKDKLAGYNAKVEADRIAEQDRLNQKAQEKYLKDMAKSEKKGETPPPPPAPIEVKQEIAEGMQSRDHWVFRVKDIKLVPFEFLAVDEVAINNKIRTGVRNIPGLEIYQKTIVAIKI